MKVALAALVFAVACGPMIPPPKGGPTGGSDLAAGSGSGAVAPSANPGFPGVFAFAEMKFFLGDDLGLQLHADGAMEENAADPGQPVKWTPMGKLTTDGRLLGPNGSELGGVQPDGSFKSSHGEVAPFKFSGESLVIADKTLTIDAQGVFRGGGEGEKPLRVEGTTDAGTRRAALFMLALAFSSGDDNGSGANTPPPPAH